MTGRLRVLGALLATIGVICLIAGAVAFIRTNGGRKALETFSSAQNVQLSYNEAGELTDRGTTEGAQAIMSLLTDDWGYPVIDSELDPDDPIVNTPSEYMFQMATIGYHVLNGTQTVVIDEPVEFNGETIEPGSYEVAIDGRYWTDFDRTNPLDGPAREQAWSGTVHGLFGELGVGVAAYTSIQVGYAISGLLAGLGATALLTGLGLWWVAGAGKAVIDPA